jgi:hypothetical protein
MPQYRRVNFLNSVSAWYISRCFQNKQQLIWEAFLKHLKMLLTGEKRNTVARISNLIP